jgi:pSer/pThr/pTyr-binding forkhead associated (FHA) protein
MEMTTILLSAVIALITSLITAYVTSQLNARRERVKWERQLAQELAELGSGNGAKATRLMQQFAVGYLVFELGNGRRRVFIPPVGRLSIGRAPNNDVTLSDGSVSRHHAVFEARGSKVFVIDLGASNSVRLNGERITGAARIDDGDIVQIGGTEFTFHLI